MYFSWLLFLSWLFGLVFCDGFPGPRSVHTKADGTQTWTARMTGYEDEDEEIEYAVNDFNDYRPTLVYNCAQAPSLCKTAGNYLGPGKTTKQLHYDYDYKEEGSRKGHRKDARRGFNCPGSWRDTHDCPESDQPKWQSSEDPGLIEAVMYKDDDGLRPDRYKNRFARVTNKRNSNGNPKYQILGGMFTCDEWPAATWIEGGQGAETYCAPARAYCTKKLPRTTDQDWQAKGHGSLRNWFNKLVPKDRRSKQNHDPEYTIFKFDFKMVTDTDDKHAVWVEAIGHKRYCFGPFSSGETATCKPKWDDDPKDAFPD